MLLVGLLLHPVADIFASHASDTTASYALVAGGSKGIGYAVAEALAERRYNLILIARHLNGLLDAKKRLEASYPVHVEVLVHDLSNAKAAVEIAQWCTERKIRLRVLCNVAGFGGSKDYLSLSLDTLRYMVNLNVESCMALSLTLLPLLEQHAPSHILNVSSMAGFAPIPSKNMYAATKSFVTFFSYALHYQLKDKNISVSCLAPGPVFTKPEIARETAERLGWLGEKMAVSPKRVGEIAVRKMLKGRVMIVPGTLPKLMSGFVRLVPRRFAASCYDKMD